MFLSDPIYIKKAESEYFMMALSDLAGITTIYFLTYFTRLFRLFL